MEGAALPLDTAAENPTPPAAGAPDANVAASDRGATAAENAETAKAKKARQRKKNAKEVRAESESVRREPLSGHIGRGNGYRLNVQNLSVKIDTERLKALFVAYGVVADAAVKTKDGKSRGVGFVVFSKEAEAQEAVAGLDGKEAEGQVLQVQPAERREAKGAKSDKAAADQLGSTQSGTAQKASDRGKGRGKSKDKGKVPGKGKDGKGKGNFPSDFSAPAYQKGNVQQVMAQTAALQQAAIMQQMAMQSAMIAGMAGAAMAAQAAYEPKLEGVLKFTSKYGTKRSFINCPQVYNTYAHDVQVSKDVLPQTAKEGDRVAFTLGFTDRGIPRATAASIVISLSTL